MQADGETSWFEKKNWTHHTRHKLYWKLAITPEKCLVWYRSTGMINFRFSADFRFWKFIEEVKFLFFENSSAFFYFEKRIVFFFFFLNSDRTAVIAAKTIELSNLQLQFLPFSLCQLFTKFNVRKMDSSQNLIAFMFTSFGRRCTKG